MPSVSSACNAEQGRHLVVVGIQALADIAFVFFYAFAGTVAVGHFIAKAAAKADLPERAFDLVEAAIAAGW